MPLDSSTINYKRTILAGVAAVVLTLAVNVGYGFAFLRWWSAAPQEMLRQARAGAPFAVLGLFLTAVGAILGARLAAHRPERAPRWAGLAVGAGLALGVIVVGWLQVRLDLWLPPNAVMAVFGGWLGGWLVRHA